MLRTFVFAAVYPVLVRAGACDTFKLNDAGDCAFLEDLYHDTSGASWTNNSGWLTPTSFCDWYGVSCNVARSRINRTELGSNNLEGSIPDSIANTKLWGFDVSGNKMGGPFPKALPTTLWGINLARPETGYGVEGTIPASLGSLDGLELIGAPSNRLTGTLPASLASLSSLRVFDISGNQLSGDVPSTLCPLVERVLCFAGLNQFTCPVTNCVTANCEVESCVAPGNDAGVGVVSCAAATVATVVAAAQ